LDLGRRGAVGVSAVVLLITLAVGFLVYRIIADGFRRPQSERLGCFGAFGYFVLIILGVWLATTLASRFF
jgi:hypothetical protein